MTPVVQRLDARPLSTHTLRCSGSRPRMGCSSVADFRPLLLHWLDAPPMSTHAHSHQSTMRRRQSHPAQPPTHLHTRDEAPTNVRLNVCKERVAAAIDHDLIEHLIHLLRL